MEKRNIPAWIWWKEDIRWSIFCIAIAISLKYRLWPVLLHMHWSGKAAEWKLTAFQAGKTKHDCSSTSNSYFIFSEKQILCRLHLPSAIKFQSSDCQWYLRLFRVNRPAWTPPLVQSKSIMDTHSIPALVPAELTEVVSEHSSVAAIYPKTFPLIEMLKIRLQLEKTWVICNFFNSART